MIEVQNLTKKFADRVLFNKTSLNFETGQIYALTGSSGSGKTTLLNILALLEPYDEGQIMYHEQNLKEIKSTAFFRNELGYLFQNFGLLESQTISENLDLGLIGDRSSKSEKQAQKLAALARVGLDYLDPDQKIFALSGGEAQRVALAKTILKDPPLVLADEPTAALDPKTSEEIMAILLSMKDDNRIIILATHNPMIWEAADQVVRIDDISNV